MVEVKTIDLVYFNAGGGHRAAALALQAVIAQQGRPWRVRLVDLSQVLDPARSFRRVAGFDPEELYNRRLRSGWTLGLGQELRVLQALIRMMHPTLLRLLQQHWARAEPDLVVSLVPNFNRVLYQSVRGALPGVPFVTVLTDLADLPPHFWIEPDQDQTIVCGTPRALEQARAAGYGGHQLELTSGMVLRPSFYELGPDRRAERMLALGLDPQRPTGVVMFGGQGSRQMLSIARELDDVQLVLLCGRNEALVRRLASLQRRAPHAAFGFTEDVCSAMRLGDFFIGKPGPGCLSEALHLGLPVITVRNAWTMPQERYNTDWVRERGLGIVIPSLGRIGVATNSMIRGLSGFRAAAAALDNRAVFEVPEVFARLLARALGSAAGQAELDHLVRCAVATGD
jgi:UDP-N-acetylglucosamine:LPS N-acetylglucosamine transferase